MRSKSSRRRVLVILLIAAGSVAGTADLVARQQPPRAAQDEFVPIDQLPQDEKLPAARLLITAYSVAWIAVAGYLWSIWQRLGRVEREMAEVSRRGLQRGTPPPPIPPPMAPPAPRAGGGAG